ncbi:MAG: phosphomannomutase/phosphoglucomutase [Anaerolineae bacterium]|nr:phosphomannomutase/phosphoglucomutase [Anaerolineae bacterium]
MSQVPTNIFRKYDIRGSVTPEKPELTPDVAYLVGKGYGTFMQRTFGTDRVFIGSDNRLTSAPLKKAVIDGLLTTGLHIVDIGGVMTPSVYFATAEYGPKGGGIQVTGSHLSLAFNGIKMAYNRLALSGDQIQAILQLILADDFITGEGKLEEDLSIPLRHMDVIASKVKLGPRKLRIALDAGNGYSGMFMEPVYRKLGVEVVCLYCEPDGTFPNHLPNPEDPETTKDLEKAVVDYKCDVGVGFDGDADRCGLIDDHGHHIAADRLLALLARDMLPRHPGAKVVFDAKVSQALFDEINKAGGIPIMWKSGHSLMKAKMAEEGALLGGEVSGHLFIGEDYYGFDDAGLVSLKALQIISNTEMTVSELFSTIPTLLATPEIIMVTPDDVKFPLIEALQKYFASKYEVNTIDGARVMFPDGWGLVRASNTQPAITMRFEGRTPQQVTEYMEYFNKQLDAYPQVERQPLLDQIEKFKKM